MNNADIIKNQIVSIDNNMKTALAKIGSEAVKIFGHNMDREGIQSRTGKLRAGIKIGNIKDNEVEIEDNVDYADYVDEGTDRMKARPFMIDSPELDKIIEDTINKEIENGFNK